MIWRYFGFLGSRALLLFPPRMLTRDLQHQARLLSINPRPRGKKKLPWSGFKNSTCQKVTYGFNFHLNGCAFRIFVLPHCSYYYARMNKGLCAAWHFSPTRKSIYGTCTTMCWPLQATSFSRNLIANKSAKWYTPWFETLTCGVWNLLLSRTNTSGLTNRYIIPALF